MVYMEMFSQIAVPMPLTNSVLALCRAIRIRNPDCRIFILDLLPRIGHATVLGPGVPQTNRNLFESIISVNHRLGNIFMLSVHEHFHSRCTGLISPAHKYFRASGDLTTYGCMILRECVFREAGMKRYWFDEESE